MKMRFLFSLLFVVTMVYGEESVVEKGFGFIKNTIRSGIGLSNDETTKEPKKEIDVAKSSKDKDENYEYKSSSIDGLDEITDSIKKTLDSVPKTSDEEYETVSIKTLVIGKVMQLSYGFVTARSIRNTKEIKKANLPSLTPNFHQIPK